MAIAIGQITLAKIYDGEKGDQGYQGVSISNARNQYYLSTSNTELIGGSWSYDKPAITSNTFLWSRIENTLYDPATDTTSVKYSAATYDATMTGVLSEVDSINNSITNKVWQTDINNSIDSYDGSTAQAIRDRVTQTETDISGITSRVSDTETDISDLGSRMSTAESSIEQQSSAIALKVNASEVYTKTESDNLLSGKASTASLELKANKATLTSEINASADTVKISADRVNIEGAAIFTSGRLSEDSLDDAYDSKGAAATAEANAKAAIPTDISELNNDSGYQTSSDVSSAINTATSGMVTSVTAKDQYYLSTSNTSATGGSWQDTVPTWSSGKYIWVRVATTKTTSGGTSTTTYSPQNGTYDAALTSALITSASAEATANSSAASVVTTKQYYLSTSSSSATGGSWGDSVPTWSSGKFIWIRFQIVTTLQNGTSSTTYTPSSAGTYDSALTSALSTANAAAPKTSALGRSQRIYYRKTSEGAPAKNETWLSTSGTGYGNWSLKVPPLTNGSTKYPYLYTAVQTQTVSQQAAGTACTCSDVQIDDTATIIDGGTIITGSVTANQLATDAIKSSNYQASTNTSSPFSAAGTFLNLSNGNIYTQNFGVDNTSGAAYLNGEIVANAGRIGNANAERYWQIGSMLDYNGNWSAGIIGHGNSYIQSGDLQLHDGVLNTQSYTSSRQITYLLNDSTYWDFGLQAPELDTTTSGYVAGVDDNFLYIRNHENTIPSLKTEWNYVFRVDKNGMIWINGQSLDQKYASIDGVDGSYLPLTGGTISGSLTVTGSINGTATKATQLTHSLTINGTSWDGSSNTTIGTMGVGYGGTGATIFTSGAALIGNGSGAIQTRAIRNNTSTGALGWTSSSTDNTLITTNTLAYWNGAYQSTNSNLEYVKLGKLGTVVTHDFDEFISTAGGIIDGTLQVTDLQAGSLIVNGVGRFVGGLYGDLSGNAATATKLANSKTIQTNLASTSAASFDGSANVTPGVTGTLGVGNGGTGQTSAINAANAFLNALSTGSSTPVDADYYISQYVGGGTTTTTYHRRPMSALWAYIQGKISSVLGLSTSGYTGNAATATKATQDGSGNTITSTYLKLSGGTMTGQIQKAGVSASWHKGRDTAAFRVNSISGYSPTISTKTTNGSWEIGAYNNDSFTDDLVFTYILDTNYTSNTNATTAQIKFLENGHIVASGFDGTATAAGKISATRAFTIGKTTKNVDWSGAVSFTKAEISDEATNTASGWMSADDKQKLDSITVSDIGTIGANSIRGEKDISVTITSGVATVGHANTAITAGTTAVTANNTTLTNGGTFKIPSITYDAYGHITGTAINTLTLPSITSVTGNAGTATKFASAQSVTLTGDTTGTASSQAGWSITTKTDRLSTVGDNRAVATKPNDYANKFIFQGLKTNSSFGSPSTNTYSYVFGLRGWSDNSGGKAHEFAFNDSGINHRIGATDTWEAWEKLVTSANYTDYTVTKTGSGASGTWGISISGNAATATADASGNTITSTYVKKAGDTMTGQLKTSFKSSVATGSYAPTATTVEALCEELRYSSGVMGSVSIGSAYTKDDITISAKWYNFLWIPHRSGGVNGTATSDNCNYGSLYLSGMTDSGLYMIRYSSSAISEVKNLYNPPNAVLAAKATADADGNTISSTYAKLSGATFTGNVQGTNIYASGVLATNTANSSTAGGLALYSTNPNSYGIAMRGTGNTGKHGYVQGDWAIATYMSGADNRGWLWKNATKGTNVASISNLGEAVFSGSVTIGGNTTNTSGCRQEFDSTLNCLNFVFN